VSSHMRIPWYLFKLGSNSIIFEIFNNDLFEMPNFRKLQGREKLQKIGGNLQVFFHFMSIHHKAHI
jgi:hypothetical protein